MRATDGGGYVSIQGSVWHRLLCGAQATGALEASKCMWNENWSIILMTSAESMSDKFVGRRGWETDRRNRNRPSTRSSLHLN